jgi:RNA polymerase sigma-70 factor (ECF subfamily)
MTRTSNDRLLVEQFKQGDIAAFERIVSEFSAEIAVLANRLLGWPGEVEDVVQDVFLAAFVGLKKFRGDCGLKTWLFTITINKCRTYRYRRILHLRQISATDDKVPLSDDSASDSLLNSELFVHIRRAVRALPSKYREPIVLTYLQELPTDQICEILGISENALKVRLNRARNRLKVQLAELME